MIYKTLLFAFFSGSSGSLIDRFAPQDAILSVLSD
jgi:hypothetical protein